MKSFLDTFGDAVSVGRPDRSDAPEVVLTGTDQLPSAFAVTEFAAASIANAGQATARLIDLLGGARGPVVVDRRLASIWFATTLRPSGWELPALWDSVAGNYLAQDRFVRLHTNAPRHRLAALELLDLAELSAHDRPGSSADRELVAAAVATWDAFELHERLVAAGGVGAALRTRAEWAAHPQGRAVASEPLVHLSTSATVAESPRAEATARRPLNGVRVLDLTRVLAGPVSTRYLAGLGADVLRIDPLDWNEPGTVPEVNLGKRSARLDLRDDIDREQFTELLATADIMIHGYRLGALDGLGFDTATRRSLNPGLVDVSLNAYGHTGPWSTRRGFDSVVQVAAGIAATGMEAYGTDGPKPLPVQALDHATGYTMAACAVEGWRMRLDSGHGSEWKTSLAAHGEVLAATGDTERVNLAAAFPPFSPGDESADLETTDWGPAYRARPPVSWPATALAWPSGAVDHGSAPAQWGRRAST